MVAIFFTLLFAVWGTALLFGVVYVVDGERDPPRRKFARKPAWK